MSKKNLTGILLKQIILFVQYFIAKSIQVIIFHNLLDYDNEYIEKVSVDEDKDRNSLLLIDSSINEKINLRESFDVPNVWKELNSLKNIRRNDQTPITNKLDEILNHDFQID